MNCLCGSGLSPGRSQRGRPDNMDHTISESISPAALMHAHAYKRPRTDTHSKASTTSTPQSNASEYDKPPSPLDCDCETSHRLAAPNVGMTSNETLHTCKHSSDSHTMRDSAIQTNDSLNEQIIRAHARANDDDNLASMISTLIAELKSDQAVKYKERKHDRVMREMRDRERREDRQLMRSLCKSIDLIVTALKSPGGSMEGDPPTKFAT